MDIKNERYSIAIEIEDDLFDQFEAVAGPQGTPLSADVQHRLIDVCGDDYSKLLKLNAWIFLWRLMPAKEVILDLKRTCDYGTLGRFVAAGTSVRNRHNPDSERLLRTTRVVTRHSR